MTATIRWVDTAELLAELLPAWRATWERDPEADLFAHPDWFACWWAHFGDGRGGGGVQLHLGETAIELPVNDRRLAVAVLEAPDELLGVWPLTIVGSRWRRCPVRALAAPTNRHAPRSGLVLSTADACERAARLGQMLAALQRRRDWDIFVHDGIAAAPGLEALSRLGERRESCGGFAHSRLSLTGDWDAYLRSRGRHFRQRLTQPRQAMEELGTLRVECYSDETGLAAALAAFDRIEAGSWKADAGEVIAASDAAGHYRELASRFGRLGACHVWLLHIGDEPAAGFVCIALRGVVYLLKTSYQTRFASARHAPSRVLLGLLIEHYWRSGGWRLIDCVGRMPFVERWTPETLPLASWLGYRRGLRGSAPYWLGRARHWAAALRRGAGERDD